MKKVLVIEDDEDTAQCLDYLMDDLGFQFIPSQTVPSVAEIIKTNPDVILLDYFLRNGYGDRLCSELKSNSLTKDIPVILMSTHNNLKNIANDCGADAYLEKPFDLDNLNQMFGKFTSVHC